MGLTGTVTLDGGGNPNSVSIFRAVSTLVTAAVSPSAAVSTVLLTNGAQAANVFWVVGSSATLGTWSQFSGTILAHTWMTATTGASIDGRLIALGAAVTLDTNNIAASAADTLPIVTITSPTLTKIKQPTITGTSDKQGAQVAVAIDDQPVSPSTTVDPNGNWTQPTSNHLTNGTHSVSVTITDAAGNSTSATQDLTEDTTPPALSIAGGSAVSRTPRRRRSREPRMPRDAQSR